MLAELNERFIRYIIPTVRKWKQYNFIIINDNKPLTASAFADTGENYDDDFDDFL